MPPSPIPDEYKERPPAGFDPEWAKFVLQYNAANARRPLLTNLGTFVAVASSLIALVVSFVNAVNLSEDRKEQTRKAALERSRWRNSTSTNCPARMSATAEPTSCCLPRRQ
jgi:hypothetical protein